jgi:hypothetical protein
MADDALVAPNEEGQAVTEATRLQQYEIVWISPVQYQLPEYPEGSSLEIRDFLGPGDLDPRGHRTVWVRGPVIKSAPATGKTCGLSVASWSTLAIPHDQPRVCRTGDRIHPPSHS